MNQDGTKYEFTTTENETIGRLALKMRKAGFWFEIFGAVLLVHFVFKLIPRNGDFNIEVGSLIAGALFLILGNWTRRASWAFERVVSTQGNDIPNLMEALTNLLSFYTLVNRIILWVIIFTVIFAVIVTFAVSRAG